MLDVFATALLIAASAAPFTVKDKPDNSRYLIWIEKFDGTYSKATGSCGSSDYCSIKVGKHEVTIGFPGISGYDLSVRGGDSEEPAYCCVFADGSGKISVNTAKKLHIRNALLSTARRSGEKR